MGSQAISPITLINGIANLVVFAHNEFNDAEIDQNLGDLARNINNLKSNVETAASSSIPSDSEFKSVASSFMTAVNKYTTTGQCTYSASGTYSSCPSNTLFPCAAATCMNADIVAIGSICSKRRKREALLPDFSFKGANNWLVDHFSLPQQWKYNSRNQNLTHHHSSTYNVKNSIRNRHYHHHSESSLKKQSHFPQDVSTFWNIVYKPLKSIVDKFRSSDLFSALRRAYYQTNLKKQSSSSDHSSIFPPKNQVRRQLDLGSFQSIFGGILNVGLTAANLANFNLDKTYRENQLSELESDLVDLEKQIEGLESVANNILTCGCDFATEIEKITSTTIGTSDQVRQYLQGSYDPGSGKISLSLPSSCS